MMSNTIRDLSELLTLFADNNSNQITAQDLRDLIVTTESWRFSGDYNDLENLPDLGSLSSQNSNNVSITGGSLTNLNNLSLIGSLNPGLNLPSNTFSTTKVTVRSHAINFKLDMEHIILTVPDNYMFLIDSMEVLTTNLVGENSTLRVRFGTSAQPEEYIAPFLVNSDSIGSRHILEVPQNATIAGSSVTLGISSPSSAEIHQGFGILSGSLVKLL